MLEHGKAVLCEKPIGLTGDQAEEMADFAKEMVSFAAALLMESSGFLYRTGHDELSQTLDVVPLMVYLAVTNSRKA